MAAQNLEKAIVSLMISKPHLADTRADVEKRYDAALDAKDKRRIDELGELRRLLGEHDRKINAEPKAEASQVSRPATSPLAERAQPSTKAK